MIKSNTINSGTLSWRCAWTLEYSWWLTTTHTQFNLIKTLHIKWQFTAATMHAVIVMQWIGYCFVTSFIFKSQLISYSPHNRGDWKCKKFSCTIKSIKDMRFCEKLTSISRRCSAVQLLFLRLVLQFVRWFAQRGCYWTPRSRCKDILSAGLLSMCTRYRLMS